MSAATAEAFARARRTAAGLAAWPGDFPETLEDAYAQQQAVASAWGRPSGGVKVGRVLGEWAERFGVNRFSGPIDADAIRQADEEAIFPVIAGGTALLECEIVAVLGQDAPDGAISPEQARDLVAGLHVGIEVAGSPMADINALGPLASIACFGNNNGALLGPAIADWRALDLSALGCIARIDGAVVGQGDTSRLPGGIWAALAFAATQGAALGQPLREGQIVCTGALTGMHPIAAGQRAEADFGALGVVRCHAVAQAPHGAMD
ncbi:2-keto-4-pentenoate hydratase [Novosphingobium rosa]|uniref:2-keto-4-pentenoate hydratase n=1 Tax=Novosphingobium rosa TaxID=76978 RepID=UPI00082FEF90|nr:fumarylacetoacetate hydrolase family protein [Novosphingobium rosa]